MRLLRSGLPFVFFLLCELNICFETGVLLETIPAMPYVHQCSLALAAAFGSLRHSISCLRRLTCARNAR